MQSYQIPASEARPEFDDLTTLAASICESPVTMINLIDDKDQWSKSIFGISEWHRRSPVTDRYANHYSKKQAF
jgi:hypothetical protein